MGEHLRQLALPECAVGKLRVRERESRFRDGAIAEADDVQVDGP
jgi:hypothetical protein